MKKQLKMAILAAAVAVGGLMAAAPSAEAAYCRPYVQTYTVDGVTQTAHTTACLMSDGSWRVNPNWYRGVAAAPLDAYYGYYGYYGYPYAVSGLTYAHPYYYRYNFNRGYVVRY